VNILFTYLFKLKNEIFSLVFLFSPITRNGKERGHYIDYITEKEWRLLCELMSDMFYYLCSLPMLSLYVLSMIYNSDCLFGQRKKPHIKGVINTKGKKDTIRHMLVFLSHNVYDVKCWFFKLFKNRYYKNIIIKCFLDCL
jgi:hypothetical protein